jgi:hypothetical protein
MIRRSTGFGVLAIGMFAGLVVYLAPLDPNILKLQFAFNERSFNAVLSNWDSIGVARYRSHFPADFLLLVAYGMYGLQFGRERAPKLVAQPRLTASLTWALPLAAIADATEDALHLVLTGPNAPASPILYLLSGSAASIKWLGIGGFLVCVALSARTGSE